MKRDNSDLHEVWRHSANLAGEFCNECRNDFDFLIAGYGFNYESGLWDFSSPNSKLKNIPEELSHAFLCIARFTKEPIKIEFSYGDRESIIEGRIWYNQAQENEKFGLWEILNAANINFDKIAGNMWVNTSDFLGRTLDSMRECFIEHIDLFLNEDPKLIDRALELRGQQLKYDLKIQRLRDLERARVKANEKFKAGYYAETIEILLQFVDILSDADRAKIAISEKRIKE